MKDEKVEKAEKIKAECPLDKAFRGLSTESKLQCLRFWSKDYTKRKGGE